MALAEALALAGESPRALVEALRVVAADSVAWMGRRRGVPVGSTR